MQATRLILKDDLAAPVFRKIRLALIGDALWTGIYYILNAESARTATPQFRILRDYFPGGLLAFGIMMTCVAILLVAGYFSTPVRIIGNVTGVFVYVFFAVALLVTGQAGAGAAHLFLIAFIHMIGATRRRV